MLRHVASLVLACGVIALAQRPSCGGRGERPPRRSPHPQRAHRAWRRAGHAERHGLVRGGRIAAIAAGDVRGGPPARREIDGAGRTLIPGLIDAHVHVTDWSLPLFLRFGVTTVRDLHNAPAYILPLARDDAPRSPAHRRGGRTARWSRQRLARRPHRRVGGRRADGRARAGGRRRGRHRGRTRASSAALTDAVVREATRPRRAGGSAPRADDGARGRAGGSHAASSTLSGVADAASDEPRMRRSRPRTAISAGGSDAFEREWARLIPPGSTRSRACCARTASCSCRRWRSTKPSRGLADRTCCAMPALTGVRPA